MCTRRTRLTLAIKMVGSDWLRLRLRVRVRPVCLVHRVCQPFSRSSSSCMLPGPSSLPPTHTFRKRTSASNRTVVVRLNCTTQGTSTSYLDTVHHRVSLEDLTPGTRFFYRCGHPTTPAYDAGASNGLPAVDIYLASGSGNGGEVDSSETNARDVAGYGSMWSHVSSFVTAPGPERCAADR